MKMSLTPGPWKAARVYSNNAPDSFKVFTKPFGGVCVADCGDNEENANLCAAAPALVETLRCIANQSCGDDWTPEEAIRFIKQEARSALANIEGRKQ
jgi:hypothetical protein